MNKRATSEASATRTLTVHGNARLRKGLLARLSFAVILTLPSDLLHKKDTRLSRNGANQERKLQAPLAVYTLIDCRGCRKSWLKSGAGRHFQPIEFQVEAAAGESQLAGRARDVAVMFAQSFGNHAALNFGQRIRQSHVLQWNG